MPYADAPAFVAWLRRLDRPTAEVLELTILTACRTTEVLQAEPNEFDLDRRVWNIPAGRMKGGIEHTVPLSKRAASIIRNRLKRAGAAAKYLFPGQKDWRPYSDMALLKLLNDLGIEDATVHGFRSTFRDWARVVAKAREDTIEISLAHVVGSKTQRAYARDQLLEERAKLMDQWARYVSQN